MPAALLMAGFLGSLRGLLTAGGARLDTLAAELSEALRTSSADTRFVTAFLAIAEDGVLRFVNAGHEAGLLLAPPGEGGDPRLLPSTGPALGLLPGSRFHEERVPLPPGATLVLYTDGLTECEDPAGSELGRERVARLVAGAAGEAPDQIVSRLIAAAAAHAAGAPFKDDVTILCLSRKSSSGAPA
jgi:sigma-B regulation protein RsbU (phosphoserine phosphatase)